MNPDPGLQPERTGLAWKRTALTAAACTLLLADAAVRQGWGALPAVLTGTAAVVLAAGGQRRHRDGAEAPVDVVALLLVAALVVLACLVALFSLV
ncbi:DUF202 domain-containing protein [Saccharothrix syringae]|uniref:DUF202 domain-containing protein n=1 Tax=Saccharothrix syringae TaxID=103733 RepID=A0A5Q0H0X2_SACSY|nr:DUF202 domain-containing protein [Saccharothrix syringae]QFZ19504.1 DUF202 domain-containing protein [Saccharothrix syringae]